MTSGDRDFLVGLLIAAVLVACFIVYNHWQNQQDYVDDLKEYEKDLRDLQERFAVDLCEAYAALHYLTAVIAAFNETHAVPLPDKPVPPRKPSP